MDNIEEIKAFFDDIVKSINCPQFIEEDPVQFPRRYEMLQDQEIAGFLTALISWGKRSMIIRNADKMLNYMGVSPYDFIMNGDFEDLPTGSIHRTFNSEDLQYICKGLKHIYSNHHSLEVLFENNDMFDGIQNLRDLILEGNNNPGFRSEKHIASPAKNSACKRIHMFLKWMVRNDGIVDLGIWKNISSASLYIPLDIHVINVSRHFGLLTRSQNDRKAVEELTAVLKSFCPEDPVKYDYALFGLGVGGYMKGI